MLGKSRLRRFLFNASLSPGTLWLHHDCWRKPKSLTKAWANVDARIRNEAVLVRIKPPWNGDIPNTTVFPLYAIARVRMESVGEPWRYRYAAVRSRKSPLYQRNHNIISRVLTILLKTLQRCRIKNNRGRPYKPYFVVRWEGVLCNQIFAQHIKQIKLRPV